MDIEFCIKAIIPDMSGIDAYTVYMYSSKDKILIPVTTGKWECESILIAKEKKIFPRPHIHNTFLRTIYALKAKVLGCIVYKVIDDVFYAYIRILKNSEIIDIDSRITDAMCISLLTNTSIMFSSDVVNMCGIKITKELIHDSLGV